VKNISIVVPIYNESLYLPEFIKQLQKLLNEIPEITCVNFVNDGSTDKTAVILEQHRKQNSFFKVITFKTNQGKGAAMQAGYLEAQKMHSEAVIFMDADLQHQPLFLKEFLKQLKSNKVVFGYRVLGSKAPLYRRVGNVLVRALLNYLFRINRRDILCGFFAIRKELFPVIKWTSADYGVETEISTVIARLKVSFSEIKISTIYHKANKGVNLGHALLILLRVPFFYYRKIH
jgi:glycosyltransferase involved in cell wall biosynthesis